MNVLKKQEILSFEEFAKEWNAYQSKIFVMEVNSNDDEIPL